MLRLWIKPATVRLAVPSVARQVLLLYVYVATSRFQVLPAACEDYGNGQGFNTTLFIALTFMYINKSTSFTMSEEIVGCTLINKLGYLLGQKFRNTCQAVY